MDGPFDMNARAVRRERARRTAPDLFLLERAFGDCLERLSMMQRQFEKALMIGCPDSGWPKRLEHIVKVLDVADPGSSLAADVGGATIVEDCWAPPPDSYDLVLAIGTLDTVNGLPTALRAIRESMTTGGLFMGALSGGNTLPQLRSSMRAADAVTGLASPHVHPRIEAASLAPLLAASGFHNPVVDVDRAVVSYRSMDQLVTDLRHMAATNVLRDRPRFIGRRAKEAAEQAFASAADHGRTMEVFEILHFAAWTRGGVMRR